MIIINPVNERRFSLNGIQYLKNYITEVHGNNLIIFNCYENKDVLVQPAHYSQFMVSGSTFISAAALQAALLDVLYSRASLGGDVLPVDQDNIDIVKPFTILSGFTDAEILSAINGISNYDVNEKQSIWFSGSTRAIVGQSAARVVKYKMLKKGKGNYGSGSGTKLAMTDLLLVYSNNATSSDISNDPLTQTVNFGVITGQTVSQWLNTSNTTIVIQAQDAGYTLFKGSINGVATSCLFVGPPGSYGLGKLQSTFDDFQPLSETSAPPVQDNIDIVKPFQFFREDTDAGVVSRINSISTYTVNERESIWFTGTELGNFTGLPRIMTYKMVNRGKGTYGSGGIQLTADNLLLVYTNEATLDDITADPYTQTINFTITGQTLNQWLNSCIPALAIQPQNEGYTILKGTINGVFKSYLWVGAPGSYGGGQMQSVASDVQLLSEAAQGPYIPTLKQVISANGIANGLNQDIVIGRTTATGYAELGLDSTGAYIKNGGNKMQFYPTYTEASARLKIDDAIDSDDAVTLGQIISIIHKPVKIITDTTDGLSAGIYTLKPTDSSKWLSFNLSTEFTVLIPANTFPANTLIEGDVIGAGQASFLTTENLTLLYGPSEMPKTAEMNSVFGLKFRSATNILLYGKLELA